MATITKAGKQLREELNKVFRSATGPNGDYIGFEWLDTLSLLMRRAKRYATMQEQACSYEWANGPEWDAKEKRLEASISHLVALLPGVKGVSFGGDPRGYTVKLILNCGRGNTWGGDSEGWGIA